MKPATAEILERIKKNFDEVPPAQAQQDFFRIIEALVELFVDEEPGLVNPKIDASMKGAMFFKALLKLGGDGLSANSEKDFIPEEDWEKQIPFMAKMKKFLGLEEILTRYSANVA